MPTIKISIPFRCSVVYGKVISDVIKKRRNKQKWEPEQRKEAFSIVRIASLRS